MNISVLGESVRGASHIRSGTECQDSKKVLDLENGIHIIAIADGHGSKACPYSKTGSTIAVNVFCNLLENICQSYNENWESLFSFLNREGEAKIAQEIDMEWKKRVLKIHSDNKRNYELTEDGEKDKKKIINQYGTTLVGIVITPLFVFAFQIGDGDIVIVNKTGVLPFIESEKILGVETHSLSKADSWQKALSSVRKLDTFGEYPLLFMLSTDGFSNSYKNDEEYRKTCSDYYEMLNTYGTNAIKLELKKWLKETSEMGCGDDITLQITYLTNDSSEEF